MELVNVTQEVKYAISITESESKALDQAIREIYETDRKLIPTDGPLSTLWNILP